MVTLVQHATLSMTEDFESLSQQTRLCGSYGGATGKPAGIAVVYGFYKIDVCQQSPLIIQFQSGTPFCAEPIDGIIVSNLEPYNRVLGHGRAQGIIYLCQDSDEPGRFRISIRNTFTFPAL